MSAASIEAQGPRTHRKYLDYLIGISKLSARELGLRYRLNLERPDSVLSGRVQENIATLQGFYRDTFQCGKEPYPVIPDKLLGKAPFFLQYDEWLAQPVPFYGENFYPITATFASGMDAYLKKQIHDVGDEDTKWFVAIGDIEDLLNAAQEKLDQGQFKIASKTYQQADDLALLTLKKLFQKKADDPVYASDVLDAFQARLQELKALPMNSADDLEAFVEYLRPADYIRPAAPQTSIRLATGRTNNAVARSCAYCICAFTCYRRAGAISRWRWAITRARFSNTRKQPASYWRGPR